MTDEYKIRNVHFRLTSRCNFNCLHCYAAGWKKRRCDLDGQTILSIISQAVDLGCESINFTGGEPLLHQNIIQSIEYCHQKGLLVSIETNGYLLDEFVAKKFSGLESIRFDVSYEGVHQRDAEKGDKVRENIALLAKMGLHVRVQSVITPLNKNEIDEILSFSQSLGIRNRVFLGHNQVEGVKELPFFEYPELMAIITAIEKKYTHLDLELPRYVSGKPTKYCGWGISRCEIMPNGDVTSCGPIAFVQPGFIAGNVKDSSLKELWNSEHFTRIRNLQQRDFIGICSQCQFWAECRGSCRAISSSVGGELLSPYPACEQYARAFQKERP